MRNLIGGAVAATLVAAGLGLGAAPAGAADAGRVAIDSEGTAHFGWLRHDGVNFLAKGRTWAADGELGAPQYLSPTSTSAFQHDVVRGPAGTAVHYWVATGAPGGPVLKARRFAADGSLGPVQTISEPGVPSAARAAADPEGNVVFVWIRGVGGKFVVETRRRATTGALSTVKRLSAAVPTHNAVAPDVAVDAAGNATVAWQVLAQVPYLQIRRRAEDGTLSAVQNLTSGDAAADPDVGVDAGGNAVVAFRRMRDGKNLAQVRRRGAAGGLSTIQDLSTPTTNPLIPQVAVAKAAGATVAWSQLVGSELILQASRRPPGGSWSPPQDITSTGSTVQSPQVAVDADGDVVFAWRWGAPNAAGIRARRWTSGGALSPIQDLTAEDAPGADPRLAVADGGAAVVTWAASSDGKTQVYARRRTPAGELSAVETVSY